MFTLLFGVKHSGLCVFTSVGDEILDESFENVKITYLKDDLLVEILHGKRKGKVMLFKVPPQPVKKLVDFMQTTDQIGQGNIKLVKLQDSLSIGQFEFNPHLIIEQ